MSISPKVVDRKKDKTVKLHMRVQNDEGFTIKGKIIMEIVSENKETIRTIEKNIILDGKQIVDEYFSHDTSSLKTGRYWVNGRFVISGREFMSETSKNDFFDVVK